MDIKNFDLLEKKIDNLLEKFAALKNENLQLEKQNRRLLDERDGFKSYIDSILRKLEGIQ